VAESPGHRPQADHGLPRQRALYAHRDDPGVRLPVLIDEAREAGEPMADRTAGELCSDLGWFSVFGKKRGRNGRKSGPPVRDDLVQRNFTADAPSQLWLGRYHRALDR